MRVVDITIFFFGLVCEEEHPLLPSYFGSTFDVSSLVCFYHIDRSRSRKSILCWSTYFILFLDEFQVRHCHGISFRKGPGHGWPGHCLESPRSVDRGMAKDVLLLGSFARMPCRRRFVVLCDCEAQILFSRSNFMGHVW